MKKYLLLFVVIAVVFTSCSSTPDEGIDDGTVQASCDLSEASESAPDVSAEPDTTRPVIRVKGANEVIIVKQGEAYDLMQSVTGSDDRDGDITDKITVEAGGFDPDIAGEYTVTYSLKDSAGNAAKDVTKKIIVRQTAVLEELPIYDGAIDGEVLNPANPAVYGGAWYHKVVSSRDNWLGIEATVTLPSFEIRRYKDDYDSSLAADPFVKNLDNPSVYMGGNAKYECDVGLSLSLVLLDSSTSLISTGSYAFRPFWRYITTTDQDVGGYNEHNGEYAVTANGNNCAANYHWKYTEYYYLPGDTLRMLVYVVGEDKMQLQIEVISKSDLPESVEIREKFGWKDPENFVSPVFTVPECHNGMELKRVNAIDQSGNEGKVAIATNTIVFGAVWHDTYLYREIDGNVFRVPMTDERKGVVNAPYEKNFTVTTDGVDTARGGEVVTIHPAYSN